MTRSHALRWTALAAASAVLLGTGCQNSNTMAEASARRTTLTYDVESGNMNHLYWYYPDQQVYYSPYADQYTWLEPTGWRRGHQPPGHFNADGRRVPVELPVARPDLGNHHAAVRDEHPSLMILEMRLAAMQSEPQGVPVNPEQSPGAFASVPTDR